MNAQMMLIGVNCAWTDQRPHRKRKGAILHQALDSLCEHNNLMIRIFSGNSYACLGFQMLTAQVRIHTILSQDGGGIRYEWDGGSRETQGPGRGEAGTELPGLGSFCWIRPGVTVWRLITSFSCTKTRCSSQLSGNQGVLCKQNCERPVWAGKCIILLVTARRPISSHLKPSLTISRLNIIMTTFWLFWVAIQKDKI